MQLITLLILLISLKATFVSLTECKNSNHKCIELCCALGQTYVEDIKECQDIPDYAVTLWLSLVLNMTRTEKVSFVENDECSLSLEQTVVDKCFAPYYKSDADAYILKEYSNVPCARFSTDSETSIECKNPNAKCIELCCGIDQTYEEDIKECQDIPEHAIPQWFALMRNMTNKEEVNFKENEECSLSLEQTIVDKCFAPYYKRDADAYILKEYSNVPCARFSTDSDSSSECKNLNGKCIDLCCEMGQTYVEDIEECQDIPEHAQTKWNKLMLNITETGNVSFIENDECVLSLAQSVIENCFAPYYESDADDYTLKEYFNVPCERFPEETYDMKETMLILAFPTIFLIYLYEFFSTSTHLWLGCIGYYVYVQFKEANDKRTNRKDRMRFIWFSVYVWAGSLTMNIVYKMVIKSLLVLNGLVYLIAYLNVFAFVVLSLKISLIRCRIIALSTEKHIKCKLVRSICRLCILMGIPRMIFVILTPVIGIGPFVIMSRLEPYMVFGTFVAEKENWCTLLHCKFCCSHSANGDNEQVTDNRTIRSTTSV